MENYDDASLMSTETSLFGEHVTAGIPAGYLENVVTVLGYELSSEVARYSEDYLDL